MGFIKALRKRVVPEKCLLDMLDGQTISGSIDEFLVRRNGIEAYAIGHLCNRLYVAGDPLRSHFKDAIVEGAERRFLQYNLQDVYGVVASKCVVLDFHLMAQTSSIRDMIKAHNYDTSSLVARIEGENVGALPTLDQPVFLLRQEWNGRCWIGNSGSSHKLASLWFLERERNQSRMMNCEEKMYAFSDHFKNGFRSNACWIFSGELPFEVFAEARELARRAGCSFVGYRNKWHDKGYEFYSLVVDKKHKFFHKFNMFFRDAFEFSSYLKNGAPEFIPGHRHNEFERYRLPEYKGKPMPRREASS
ncbi:DUF6685 family protein [Thalassospira mesophila]|uniref:Uncharacterized protein n=1 Tax=Thalassospira mesophila TaxID=1293891 RepID=A0A1Y2KVD1_9PROT|nr:DUF6685 family protein [Thalassospira mesophila]OSQ35131.1 hypothetical protein TMES_21665 [Thalassospira mesophila]